jgi:hypothetical protein
MLLSAPNIAPIAMMIATVLPTMLMRVRQILGLRGVVLGLALDVDLELRIGRQRVLERGNSAGLSSSTIAEL